MMLSIWMRKFIFGFLLAIMVGWWIPKLLHPPRVLPTPIKKVIESYAPPHLDPKAAQLQKITPKHDTLVKTQDKLVKHDVLQRWAVQIGSYRSLAQIQPTIDALKSHGYSVVVHPVVVDHSQLYRIWVGDLDSRSAAKQLSSELKTRFQLAGFVLKLGDV
jgi:cell division septation protein DedD